MFFMLGKKTKIYYKLDEILKTNAQYNIIYGQKGNGKSFAIAEHCVKDFVENGKKVVYMRRYREDIKTVDVERYWSNIVSKGVVKKFTHGKYTDIVAYQQRLYLAKKGKNDNLEKGPCFGDYIDLNRYQHYASQAFPNVGNVILEEFITDQGYLEDEPKLLLKFVSTILRDNDGKVWMAGNTISRVCPYYLDWGLKNVRQQEKGTIDTYEIERYDEEEDEVKVTKIAVERCETNGTPSSMIFGQPAKHIINGDYDVKEVPTLTGRDTYTVLYELLFEHMDFKFIMQLKFDSETGGQFVFIYPAKFRKLERKITQKFSTDPFITQHFNQKIPAEVKMRELLREGKIAYSDTLTGNDFISVLESYQKGGIYL